MFDLTKLILEVDLREENMLISPTAVLAADQFASATHASSATLGTSKHEKDNACAAIKSCRETVVSKSSQLQRAIFPLLLLSTNRQTTTKLTRQWG